MAVLKDLIVHGPSKFIGKTQFNTINARSIGAKEGIFEKLIATTLNAETATIDDLTAQNATVVGLLDVQGELHTNAWTNANIANIGGSFYISPSVEAVSGTITINKNASDWTVQITGNFATDFIKTAGATTASAWPVDSLVLVTGNIVVNNMEYPLGTLKGKLTAEVKASAASTSKNITMTCASTYVDNPNADVLQMLYEANGNANITSAAFSNGKISMYKISGTKPIGILLSSVGITAKGSNYIDIYGGTNNDGTPNLRIGHLTGLPAISLNGKSMTPTGWGLYADNAYLSGTIHSAAGIIGGFTIDNNSLHNGTFGTANSVLVSTGTTSAANIAGSGSISGWAFTAGTTYGVTKTGALYATSGSIAGWNFNGTSLYKNSATPGASASTMVISTGTASTNNIGGGGTASKSWMLSAGTGFGVTTAGTLYATGAHISGTITVDGNSNVYTKSDTDTHLKVTTLTSDAKEFKNVASYSSSLNPGTGYVAIVTPIQPSRMCSVHITGYNYSGKDETIDVIVSFYNYTSGIVNHGFVNRGSYAIKEVRIGQVSSSDQRAVIILGSSTNKWYYPKIYVQSALVSYSNPPDTYQTGWTINAPNSSYSSYAAANVITINDSSQITKVDNDGINLHPTNNTGDYLQINSNAITFYRNNVARAQWTDTWFGLGDLGSTRITLSTTGDPYIYMNAGGKTVFNVAAKADGSDTTMDLYANGIVRTKINKAGIHMYDENSKERTLVDANGLTVKNASGNTIATYGTSIILYNPTTSNKAVEITSSGASFTGNVKATSLSTGTKTASTTGKGTYIASDGAIYSGDGSNNYFTVSATGALTAKSGTIGKYTITSTYLCTGSGSTQAGIGGDQAFWAGSTTSNSAPFRVSYGGALVSTSATITGTINATTGTFGNATNKITVGTGTSGHSALYYGMTTLASTANGFYIGTDGISLGGGKFKVTAAGAVTATSLSITQSQVSGLSTALAGKANSGAENTAKSYLDYNSTNGLRIAQSSPSSATTNMVQIKANDIRVYGNSTNGYTKITSSGMEVFANINNTATSIAFFGSTARIGKSANKHVEIDSTSFAVVGNSNIPQFSVDTGGSSSTKTYTRYLDTYDAGGSIAIWDRFVAPGIASTIIVGSGALTSLSSINTSLSVPTLIGASTTVTDSHQYQFTLTKIGRFVYEIRVVPPDPANYYSAYKYTVSNTEAYISVNDCLLNEVSRYYTPIYVETGTLDDFTLYTWGRIAQLTMSVHKSSVSSGSNIFTGMLCDYLPVDDALIAGYYGAHACIGKITQAGEIFIRNASNSSVSPTANGPLIVSATYIFDPTRTWP